MKTIKFGKPLIVLSLTIMIALLLVLSACSSSSTTTPTTTTTAATVTQTTSSGGETTTINLVAQSLSFNMSTITVKAGSRVTINFNNMDSGIQHNFAIYNNSNASQTIFKGDLVTGPATKTYTFTAPAAGTYFFRCDVHPTSMNGQLIVQ